MKMQQKLFPDKKDMHLYYKSRQQNPKNFLEIIFMSVLIILLVKIYIVNEIFVT